EPRASMPLANRPWSSLVDGYAPPQHRQRLLRGPDLSQPGRGHRKVAFGTATALGGRLTDRRTDQALLFESFERVIDAREDHRLPGAVLDRMRNRHAVRLIALPEKRQQDE